MAAIGIGLAMWINNSMTEPTYPVGTVVAFKDRPDVHVSVINHRCSFRSCRYGVRLISDLGISTGWMAEWELVPTDRHYVVINE